jgi:hypothetical protein
MTITQTTPSPFVIPVIPSSPPPSQAGQHILASALVSLSAFYATSGQLAQVQVLEESALGLLRTIQSPNVPRYRKRSIHYASSIVPH